MDYLPCYTLKDNVEDGVSVNEFECVVVEDTSTTLLKKAVLQIIPILPADNTRSLNSVSEASLSFLKVPSKKDTLSKDYIVLAVDPVKWKLCYNKDSFGLLDPCGLSGMVLLLVKCGTKHVLVNANDRHIELSVSDDNKPIISKCNRASLIYETVANNALKREVSKLPAQFLLAAPKVSTRSARSSQQAVHPSTDQQ